jgi:type II secretory pathway component PulF
VAAFLLVGLTLCFVLAVPRFETIFADMGQKLPTPTRIIMFLACWPGIVVTIGIFVAVLAAMIVGYRLPAPAGTTISAAVIVVVLCLGGLLFLGLFAPLIALIQGMQGNNPP